MKDELNILEKYIVDKDNFDEKVSKVTVGWHLHHSLKVINSVYDLLQSSDPNSYKKKFNFLRLLVYTLGKIPKGKGKAPKSVLPPDKITTEDIISQLTKAREKLKVFKELDENSNFKHPVFGVLNKKQTKRFLKIHTQHHLQIVKDILK